MSKLLDALARGATVVTPNNRLAREVAARFDGGRRDSGARTWAAAKVVPFTLWLERLWRGALAAHAEDVPRILLDKSATQVLWHAIAAGHDRGWLNVHGAARHAADAWMTFHRFRGAGESLDAILSGATHDDAVVFGQWALRYRSRLASLNAIDDALLPDALAALAVGSRLRVDEPIVMHGFLALTPQQERLVGALRGAGAAIVHQDATDGEGALGQRVACQSSREELAHALAYARLRLGEMPRARVAIVVADLDERREEVIALAEETLCPEKMVAIAPDAARPYGVSLGEPLAAVPIVAVALDLLALGSTRIEATLAACVARSRYLPEATANWSRRAEVERRWLDLGMRSVDWQDLLAAIQAVDPPLHRRLAVPRPPSRAARLPREWARLWSDWLIALGWPGTAALTSNEWQAQRAWSSVLARFASLGTVTGKLSAGAAQDALRALLAGTIFQPEAAPAQIQILGLLEAAGLSSFDFAWLAGFDAQRWPPTTSANPFLPLPWQRARKVPAADATAQLDHALAVTSALRRIAPHIVVSHVATIDEVTTDASLLFADFVPADPAQIAPMLLVADLLPAIAMEDLRENAAPAVMAGARVHGGAALFDSQSACPFQAYSRHRLRARTWPECPDGLSAGERGEMLHAMLEAFWNDVGDQQTLLSLDAAALDAHVAASVKAGRAAIVTPRWRALPPAVANVEATRLEATLRAWIDTIERTRPPFRVRTHEERIDCEIEGLALTLRVDRIDELAAGGLAVVDYKSGRVIAPARWFAERPQGIQLAVYAEAIEPAEHAPIRALAYAQLKAGEISIAGIADDADTWPPLAAPGSRRLPIDTWPDARRKLHDRVTGLARAIRRGIADVAPLASTTCAYCGLQALCRIQPLDDAMPDATEGAVDE